MWRSGVTVNDAENAIGEFSSSFSRICFNSLNFRKGMLAVIPVTDKVAVLGRHPVYATAAALH